MNFHEYANRQQSEDRRAFIVHYGPKKGKTRFARRICETRSDAHLLDLLAYFLAHPELPPIQKCSFETLKQLLLGLDVPQDIVIIDNPDFLFNTWSSEEKQNLLNWFRVQLRSPSVTRKTFALIIQTDEILAAADLRDSCGDVRVLALNEFDAL